MVSDTNDNEDSALVQMGRIKLISWNFLLFFLYFLLVIFIGFQLVRIAYYRHKIMSFKVGFLTQCFFSALLRSVFFLIFDYVQDVNWLYLIIYWIPINIQYSTFSLLIVYYNHLQHREKREWYALKKKYFAIWVITNILFLILAAIWIGLGIKYDETEANEPLWLDSIHSYFTATIFFLLVVVLAWETYRVSRLMKEAKGTQTKLIARVSWNKILTVALSLFFLFTSRTLYDFMTALDSDLLVDVSAGSDAAAMFTFIAFLMWEIIPIILVLVLFGNVSATTLGAFSEGKSSVFVSRQKKLTENQGERETLLKATLFTNPRRYDSDDETTTPGSTKTNTHVYGNNSPYNTGSINVGPQDV